MFLLEVILTPVSMKEGWTFLYHFLRLQIYASQVVGELSVFAPNLGKVAPHKDRQICLIVILNALGGFYCKIQ